MSYHNVLAIPENVKDFHLEGSGAITFPGGRMRLESLRPSKDGQEANIVLWCPEDFDGDVTIEWEFWPVNEPGLAIVFFHARGRQGEDLFNLAPRTGPYEQYHHGDLDAHHVSCFRRMWSSERGSHTCDPRESHGFHLVAQEPDPLPAALDARGPYDMRLTVAGGETAFSVNGLESSRRRDEHPPPGGKIGFRRMATPIGEYADLRVTSP
ncbi:DUF1961 family protein [Streptosporangium sp. NPDC002721]|uniref:DUF1961 family protein n=1 Tax=Streptosporangium sp. NPDC002721 TaxID=3366188 RepID=UPI00369C6252